MHFFANSQLKDIRKHFYNYLMKNRRIVDKTNVIRYNTKIFADYIYAN